MPNSWTLWTSTILAPDVNILVNAFREDAVDHRRYLRWMEDLANSDEAFGLADLVCSGFVRVVSHPKIYEVPTPTPDALAHLSDIRGRPNCVILTPRERHWDIFAGLCAIPGVRGNLVPDAYLAALAIESGSEWITMDGDYGRFPGLRWRRPF